MSVAARNLALAEELRAAASDTGIPEDAVVVVDTTDREAIAHLLREAKNVDLIIPRGGPGLIRMVTENSHIPVIAHDAGVCHIFVDASAEDALAWIEARRGPTPRLREMIEQVTLQKGGEAGRMPLRQIDIFIHVEDSHLRPVDPFQLSQCFQKS